ncbi:MAG: hypothetical protein Q9M24_07235 [Mariprofundaceae bacterium]|nr:hypothetical protein [Mariprofundaceae bacterium]
MVRSTQSNPVCAKTCHHLGDIITHETTKRDLTTTSRNIAQVFDNSSAEALGFALRASNPSKAVTVTVIHGFFVPARNSFLRVLAGIQQPSGKYCQSLLLAIRSTRYAAAYYFEKAKGATQ